MVWVFPFSADVTPHTFFLPSLVTTFPGLCTIEIPVSSTLKICIGLASKFSRAQTAASFAKKLAIVSLFAAAAAQAEEGGWAVRKVRLGCRDLNALNHECPAAPFQKGCGLPD